MVCINQESSVKSGDSGAESCDQSSPISTIADEGDVCRDYLRNVCKRGRRCKYKHPSERNSAAFCGGGGLLNELEYEHAAPMPVTVAGTRRCDFNFCHDFQNAGCKRVQCKFIHCTREEEEFFRATGQLPTRIQQLASLGLGVGLLSSTASSSEPLLNYLGGEAPLCKDFLKGQCKRATKCKFRHVTGGPLPNSIVERAAAAAGVTIGGLPQPMHLELSSAVAPVDFFDLAKRRRLDCSSTTSYAPVDIDSVALVVDSLRGGGVLDVRLLLEENALLHRKIDELHKQCQDMVATNEVLLDQNARLRNSKMQQVVTASHIGTPALSPSVMAVNNLPIGVPIGTLNMPIMTSSVASHNTIVATALPTVSCSAQVCMTPAIVVTGTPRCTTLSLSQATDFIAPSQPNMVSVSASLPASSITSIISFPASPLPSSIN